MIAAGADLSGAGQSIHGLLGLAGRVYDERV